MEPKTVFQGGHFTHRVNVGLLLEVSMVPHLHERRNLALTGFNAVDINYCTIRATIPGDLTFTFESNFWLRSALTSFSWRWGSKIPTNVASVAGEQQRCLNSWRSMIRCEEALDETVAGDKRAQR